jgi:hypothetical protein
MSQQSPKTEELCGNCGHEHVHPESCERWVADNQMCTCKTFVARPPAVDDTLEAARALYNREINKMPLESIRHPVELMAEFADERTRLLRERLEGVERDRMIELAIAQFTGWREAESCMDIIMLVTSMGLTRKEWLKVRPQVQWLPQKYRNEINEYFKLSEEFPVGGG